MNIPQPITETITLNDGRTITLETGKLAKQADGSVVVRMGDTMLLATAVASKDVNTDIDFLPLTVDYREKFSSAGKFPGGFFKREGRPSTEEILVMRLVDRVLRPLFPKNYHAETQVMIQLMSFDENVQADSLAGLAASAALAVSDIPFEGPISEVRVAKINGELKINPSLEETENATIDLMGVKHAVITSVDRDDLPDGGAGIWAETIRKIREYNPGITMETLIPDFQGNHAQLDLIIKEAPEVVSHNLETVRRLTRQVRKQAKYDRSLEVLKYLKEQGINRTKSGIMLGLGETRDEVIETMKDLRTVGVDVMTIGQYLQPTPKHLPVERYPTPKEYKEYEEIGLEMGFRFVESGPLVRSSYHAHKHIE